MFGSGLLDLAIGLVYVFAMVALLSSALREVMEAILKTRGAILERGIRELLHDVGNGQLTEQLFAHPLINSLFRGSYAKEAWDKTLRFYTPGKNLPSYIPNRNFALAILDVVSGGDKTIRDAIDSNVFKALPGPVAGALSNLVDVANKDVDTAIANVEAWYDSAMERVSGYYKRVTQGVLIAVGFLLAMACNVDALNIGRSLYQHQDRRDVAVALASKAAADPQAATAANALDDLQRGAFPIGWKIIVTCSASDPRPAGADPARCARTNVVDPRPHTAEEWVSAIFGWLLTGVAASLGAPFWFDVLNRLCNLRASAKPDDKKAAGSPTPAAAPAVAIAGAD